MSSLVVFAAPKQKKGTIGKRQTVNSRSLQSGMAIMGTGCIASQDDEDGEVFHIFLLPADLLRLFCDPWPIQCFASTWRCLWSVSLASHLHLNIYEDGGNERTQLSNQATSIHSNSVGCLSRCLAKSTMERAYDRGGAEKAKGRVIVCSLGIVEVGKRRETMTLRQRG